MKSVAGAVQQVFALTISAGATYANPSGALEPMPSTSLTVRLKVSSLLVITFSARGSVQPSGGQMVPIVFIECKIDGTPCQPDTNPVEFLYPQFSSDTRSFTWIVPNVTKGSHTIIIHWGMGNPTSAIVTNRTLIVEAAEK
jgi:hypothetical protein